MSNYLTDIASRSSSEGIPCIMPVSPGPSFPGGGFDSDFSTEAGQQDISRHAEYFVHNFSSARLVQSSDDDAAGKTVRQDPVEKEMYPVRSYFSRYIERMETKREKGADVRQPGLTETVVKEEPARRQPGEIPLIKSDKGERIVSRETGPVIIPLNKMTEERKDETSSNGPKKETPDEEQGIISRQIIQPSLEEKHIKTYDLPLKISPAEPLLPKLPAMECKAPAKEKDRQEEPRLVIGKIIVEISPPVAPIPQKIITKVVQASTGNTISKANKLSFGLGQL